MVFKMSETRDPIDILFWMLDLIRVRWPNASLQVEMTDGSLDSVTNGLEPLMYARLYPIEDIYSVSLECRNGDLLIYERGKPGELEINGMPAFVNAFRDTPPRCTLDISRAAHVFQYNVSPAFAKQNVRDQTRLWFRLSQQVGCGMYLSDAEGLGRLMPIVSRYMLDGFDAVMDIIIKQNRDQWLLWHRSTGMVYSYGYEYVEAKSMLGAIVNQ